MRKFAVKLFIAMFPLILYLGLFIAYEPYNYYGIKDDFSGSWATPLARIRAYQRKPSENIILGDSRMNHFDTGLIQDMTGDYYVNLSTGGQGLNLTWEMYQWANEQRMVKKVVVDSSFWQIRDGNNSPSAEQVFYIAEHPLEYPFTLDYVREAWDGMLKEWGIKDSILNDEDDSIEVKEAIQKNTKYQEHLVRYAVGNIYPGTENYTIGNEQLDYIINIVQTTKDNGGEVKILIPCVQESIWEYVLTPLNLEPQLMEYKSYLSQYAPLYDMEWQNEVSYRQDIFADGFHFVDRETYNDIYTSILFGEPNENVKIWNNGSFN